MSYRNSIILIALAFAVHGCLTHKSIDLHIQYADEKADKGAITITYNEIGSDSESGQQQLDDFNTLVDVCSSDDLLLDFVKQGVYLKEKTIFERDAQLHLRLSGIFENLKIENNILEREENFRVFYLNDDDVIIGETNGTVSMKDSLICIRWPADTTELTLRLITKDPPGSFYSLITYYRDWEKQQN